MMQTSANEAGAAEEPVEPLSGSVRGGGGFVCLQVLPLWPLGHQSVCVRNCALANLHILVNL